MPKKRTLLIVIALGIALAAVGLYPQIHFAFSVLHANTMAEREKGPFVRTIENAIKKNGGGSAWRVRTPFDPRLVAKDLTRREAELSLQSSKFARVPPSLKDQVSANEGVEIFQRRIGGLPCNTLLKIYLVFEGDQLVEATGAKFPDGCL